MASNSLIKTARIGGKHGDRFDFYGTAPVEKIKIWTAKRAVRGIELVYANGTAHRVGHTDGTYSSYTFGTGERVTRLALWGNGEGAAGKVGKVELATNQGNTWRAAITKLKPKAGYPQEKCLGSGYLMGMFGTHDSEIVSLGFTFLRRINHADLVHIHYNISPTRDLNCVIKRSTHLEDPFHHRSITLFGGQQTLTKKFCCKKQKRWNLGQAYDFGVKVRVSSHYPVISTSAPGRYIMKSTNHCPLVDSTMEEQTVTRQVEIRRSELKKWQWQTWDTRINTSWTGTLRLTLDNGEKHDMKVKGSYCSKDTVVELKRVY